MIIIIIIVVFQALKLSGQIKGYCKRAHNYLLSGIFSAPPIYHMTGGQCLHLVATMLQLVTN